MYSKELYLKYKAENPEKLKEYRKTANKNYKEKHPEKVTMMKREASKKFYNANREKVIARVRKNQFKKKLSEILLKKIKEISI